MFPRIWKSFRIIKNNHMYQPWLLRLTMVVAFMVGMLSAFSWKIYRQSIVRANFPSTSSKSEWYHQLEKFLDGPGNRDDDYDDLISVGGGGGHLDETLARMNKIWLTCIIWVTNENNSHAVASTWAPKCNSTFFVGTIKNLTIPYIKVPLSSSHKQFCRTIFTIRGNNSSAIDLADWILIVKDNTLVVVENLRRYLLRFNSSDLVYLGHPVKHYARLPFNAPEAGIVLSRGAFTKIVNTIGGAKSCAKSTLPAIGGIDRRFEVTIAQILDPHGCRPIDTRDSRGRARFLALNPTTHLVPKLMKIDNPFWRKSIYPYPSGPNCCSPRAITLPGLTEKYVIGLNYFIYQIRVASSNESSRGS